VLLCEPWFYVLHDLTNPFLSAAYSGDAVYLYSTTDDPGTAHSPKASPMPQNDKQMGEEDSSARTARLESNSPPPATELEEASDEGYVEEDGDGDEDEESRPDEAYTDEEILGSVPVVYPRSRFAGACNVRTVKDGELYPFFPLNVLSSNGRSELSRS
jgi:hypothetical protein